MARRSLLLRRLFFGFAALLCSAIPLAAQNQRLVYVSNAQTSEIHGWVVDPVSGTLTAVPGSPYNERLDPYAIAVHPSGKFLYVINKLANDVSAFGIDPNTGALTELAASPFSVSCAAGGPCGTDPIAVVMDTSGKFLCVLNATSDESGGGFTIGSVSSYSIDSNTGVLTPADSIDLDDPPLNPVALLADPTTENLYVAGNNGITNSPREMLATVSIDPTSGSISQAATQESFSKLVHSAAISPDGKLLYLGLGTNEGEIVLNGLNLIVFQSSAGGSYPVTMAVDSTNSYLFAQILGSPLAEFSIDSTGQLTQLLPGPSPMIGEGEESMVADPNGPFLYFQDGSAYRISASGALTALAGLTPSTGIGTFDPPTTPVQPVSGPSATFLPASLPFALQAVGTASAPRQIALSNTGSAELIISGVSITGANSADFIIQSNNCPAVLAPAPAVGCSLMIAYQPSVAGNEQASLMISDNVAGGASAATLDGFGLAPVPAVTLVPGSLIFPSTTEGASSTSTPITVTNSGAVALHIPASAILLTGANPSDFVQANTCNGATVAAQGSCTITVTFEPTAVGVRTAEVLISDDAAGSPQVVSLSGSGVLPPPSATPVVMLAPGSLNFPQTSTAMPSASISMFVIDSGAAALHIPANGVALTGANPGDFSETDTCDGSTLAAGANCTITVTFQPTAGGTRTALVLISDDAPGTPQIASISGYGIVPPFVLGSSASSSVSQTVTAGMTAQYSLQVTPEGGFTGLVSLSCTEALANATCTVPPTVAVTGAAAVPFVVTVTTTAGSVVPIFRGPGLKPASHERIRWGEWCSFLAGLFLLLALRRNRRMPPELKRGALTGAAIAVLLTVAVSLVSCGAEPSSSAPASLSAGTPSGSSTIAITASVGVSVQSLNLTLIVQ